MTPRDQEYMDPWDQNWNIWTPGIRTGIYGPLGSGIYGPLGSELEYMDPWV